LKKKADLIKNLLTYENVKYIKDFTGNTPLSHALKIKNYEIINLLFEFIQDKPHYIELINSKELCKIIKL
jgi:ankyrin repeat protein